MYYFSSQQHDVRNKDAMENSLTLALTNLTSPPVLAFALGIITVLLRSKLSLPAAVFDALSIYLLLAIGIKGGVALRAAESAEFVGPLILTLALGLLIPALAFFVLKALTPLNRTNRGAIAAHYGSTSLVTFTAGMLFIESAGLTIEGFMPTLLAVMEVPGLIVGLALAQRRNTETRWKPLLHEVLAGKSILLLAGGIAIGVITGEAGYARVEPFFGALFTGMLTLFLLQLGVQAGSHLNDLREAGWGLLAFAVAFPLTIGASASALGVSVGLSAGGAAIFGVLCASASYIAAPAAVKLSLPEANPGFSLTASLGITFPVNLLIGIPLFVWVAQTLAG
jgi:hypothetical protein